eukprot:14663846-Alexandrium_andersonii.AAC.1
MSVAAEEQCLPEALACSSLAAKNHVAIGALWPLKPPNSSGVCQRPIHSETCLSRKLAQRRCKCDVTVKRRKFAGVGSTSGALAIKTALATVT